MNNATREYRDPRWFISPKYVGNGRVAPDVDVVNAANELVATFERWSDAELAVALHNDAVGRKAA